jgi:hypothetical protein
MTGACEVAADGLLLANALNGVGPCPDGTGERGVGARGQALVARAQTLWRHDVVVVKAN